MPLLRQIETTPYGLLGLWTIAESEEFFLHKLQFNDEEKKAFEDIKGKGRRMQFLSSRYLLHRLSNRKHWDALQKDEFGKPFFSKTDHHISISHSHELSAAIASPWACGIDIQYPVPKIGRLIPRYCSKNEMAQLRAPTDLARAHIIWGAKEAIYKAYGKRSVDYRDDIYIPVAELDESGRGIGQLAVNNTRIEYDLFFELVLEYTLIYCFEKPPK